MALVETWIYYANKSVMSDNRISLKLKNGYNLYKIIRKI